MDVPGAKVAATLSSVEHGANGDNHGYEVVGYTTDGVPLDQRAEVWRDIMSSCHVITDISFWEPERMQARQVRQRSSTYSFDLIEGPSGQARRTHRHIAQWPSDDYKLAVMLQGSLAMSDGDAAVEFGPGSAALMDLASPVNGVFTQPRACILTVPRSEIDSRLGGSAMSAGIDLSSGLGRVVSMMLAGLHDERSTLSAQQFDAVCDRIVELACMLLVGDDRPTAGGRLPEVEQLVRRHVRQHAHDSELSGTAIATAVGWSLRQVQLALQQAGTTPRDLIREERLRLARDLLRTPAYLTRSISEIAAMSGFSSASALSSAFRSRYRESPREFRRHSLECGADRDRGTT